jgi:hypothetical protein
MRLQTTKRVCQWLTQNEYQGPDGLIDSASLGFSKLGSLYMG